VTIDASLLLRAAAEAAGAQQYPAATLYVVATPIGNLADLSLRAIHVLALVDAIACEDTRHSAPLLRHLGLDKPLVAVHQHNEREAAPAVLARLARGERVAYVSDAGTPGLSDPGAALVAAVVREELARAADSARAPRWPRSASPATRAPRCFAGFLPAKAGERAAALAELLRTTRRSSRGTAPDQPCAPRRRRAGALRHAMPRTHETVRAVVTRRRPRFAIGWPLMRTAAASSCSSSMRRRSPPRRMPSGTTQRFARFWTCCRSSRPSRSQCSSPASRATPCMSERSDSRPDALVPCRIGPNFYNHREPFEEPDMIPREPTLERLATARALLLEPFGLSETTLAQAHNAIATHRIDDADLYFQYAIGSWGLEKASSNRAASASTRAWACAPSRARRRRSRTRTTFPKWR
jgi:hypothetical protein